MVNEKVLMDIFGNIFNPRPDSSRNLPLIFNYAAIQDGVIFFGKSL